MSGEPSACRPPCCSAVSHASRRVSRRRHWLHPVRSVGRLWYPATRHMLLGGAYHFTDSGGIFGMILAHVGFGAGYSLGWVFLCCSPWKEDAATNVAHTSRRQGFLSGICDETSPNSPSKHFGEGACPRKVGVAWAASPAPSSRSPPDPIQAVLVTECAWLRRCLARRRSRNVPSSRWKKILRG